MLVGPTKQPARQKPTRFLSLAQVEALAQHVEFIEAALSRRAAVENPPPVLRLPVQGRKLA